MSRKKVESGASAVATTDIAVDIAKPTHNDLDEFIGQDLYDRWSVLIPTTRVAPQDIERLYGELEDALDSTKKVGHQSFELERAERNARTAYSLFLTAKTDRELWQIEHTRTMNALRADATEQLQLEKEQKVRTKQITEADVTSKIQEMFPDEFLRSETKRIHFESVEKTLEHLAKVWSDKTRSLQVLVSRGR